MLTNAIKKMMMMRPVLLKDFDMLLDNSSKSYEYDVLLKESFFQPQELFLGQTIFDLQLIDTDTIAQNLKKYRKQLDAGISDLSAK